MFATLPHNLERVRLRMLRADDLEAFHAYRSDPVVARYQGWEPMTQSEAADFLHAQSSPVEHVPGTWRQLGVAELESDALVGDVGVWLSPDSRQAEFGISIASAAQGHGYGTECVRGLIALVFSTTPVTEIVASTDARNVSCLTVLARSGMRQVDTRQAEYKGEMCTEDVFSLRKA